MIANRLVRPNRRTEYYPRFSEAEYERRRAEVREWMDARELDTLLLYGNGAMFGSGSTNVAYLSNYRGEFMSYLVFFADPDEAPTLYCGISNHLQYLAEVSVVDDIRLSIPDPPAKLAERIDEAGLTGGRTGVVSLNPRYRQSIPYEHHVTLESRLTGEIEDVTGPFVREVHSVKSEEEIEWIREGARYCDLGMEALVDAVEPGATEYELAAALRGAILEAGGEPDVAFINSAPMEDAEPGEPITWKQPSTRELRPGDVVTTEFTGTHRGYSGQIHRPIAVDAEPTAAYTEMWDVAVETYEGMLDALRPGNTARDVADATAPIEASEYKIYDVLLHGFGSAYMHPFVGTPSSNYWPGGEDPLTADWEFEEGMTVVVQPNLCDEEETRCFQVGTIAVIREDGPEVLPEYPVEFVRT